MTHQRTENFILQQKQRIEKLEEEKAGFLELLALVNKYRRERLVTDRKKMFALAKELEKKLK